MKSHKLSNAGILKNRVKLPSDFNIQRYLNLNYDVRMKDSSWDFGLTHWLKHGYHEKRRYKTI